MTKHYIQVSNRTVEVTPLRDVHGGVQVEVVRRYPAIGLCKGQLMTLPHNMITSKSERRLKREERVKAFQARKRKEAREAKRALKASESASKASKASAGSGHQTCPVCLSDHATGACKMNAADMTSK